MLTCCTKTLLHPNHFLDRTSLPVYNGNESSKPLKTQAGTDIVPPASTDIIPQASTDIVPQASTDIIPQAIVPQAGIEIVLKQAQISFSSRHRYCSQACTDIVPQAGTDIVPQAGTDIVQSRHCEALQMFRATT